jgi:hypothetical protein
VSSIIVGILFEFNEKFDFCIPSVLLAGLSTLLLFICAGLGVSLRADLVFVFLLDLVSLLLVAPARSCYRVPVSFLRWHFPSGKLRSSRLVFSVHAA